MSDGTYIKSRVFISWSGDRSREAAQAFRDWLPSVLQNVKPYFTPDDIDKGSRWAGEIRDELEATDFGIICLTRENLIAPWILFEAGALSKLEKSKVAPLLLDVEPAEVTGPLGLLQLTRFNKDEVLKLLSSINRALGDLGLDPTVLVNVFDRWWPDLEQSIKKALETPPGQPIPKKRTEREMIEEVLDRVRRLSSREPARQRLYPNSFNTNLLRRLAGDSDVLEMPIAALPLPVRGILTLEAESIVKLGQLLDLTPTGLLHVTNLGKKSQVEIIELLGDFGLSLREE